MGAGRAWRYSFPVRLACGHLAAYPGAPPAPGEHVWCLRCAGGQRVRFAYYDPASPSSWCGLVRGGGRGALRCTLPRGHGGAAHLDGPLGAWFTPPGPLRRAASGNCGGRA